MNVNEVVTLYTGDKSTEDVRALTTKLTYMNPKFIENKRLGFSTHATPKEIKTYEEAKANADTLKIARGEMVKILQVFPGTPIDDKTSIGEPVNFEYINHDFDLDDRQTKAVSAIFGRKQGIVHATTSAGKSVIILAALGELKRKAMIVVHRKILLEQLIADAKKYLFVDGKPAKIGTIAGGEFTDGDIVFAIDKSLGKKIKTGSINLKRFGVIIQDECHLASTNTFQDIISKFPARFRYGFTGTLKRKDGMEFLIFATFGRILYTITKDELVEAGRITPVMLEVLESDTEVDPDFFSLDVVKKHQAIDKALHENMLRSDIAVEKAVELANNGYRVVVLSRYVQPCYDIGKEIERRGIKVGYVTGKEKDGTGTCLAMREGDLKVICATVQCFSTGVNIPNLTDIILISPIFSNELLIHQIRGRLARKADNKKIGVLWFIWDWLVFEKHKLNRLKTIMRK